MCMFCWTGYDCNPGKNKCNVQSTGMIADEMAIGMVNQKTTAVRLIPVIGKDVRMM